MDQLGCLFCRANGPFTTVEHVIPESLGNDEIILEGIVCDACQRYLGTNVEKPALEKTMFAVWRTYLGIKTKKNKMPSVNLNPPQKGKIPAQSVFGQYDIGFTTDSNSFSTSIDVFTEASKKRLLDTMRYCLILTPWHLSIITRFLGKIGLELLTLSDKEKAYSEKFNGIRQYVRYGSVSWLWPLYHGNMGELKDLKTEPCFVNGGWEQEINCYEYSMGFTPNEECIFAFNIGIDLYLICLSDYKQLSDNFIQNAIKDCPLKRISYSEFEKNV